MPPLISVKVFVVVRVVCVNVLKVWWTISLKVKLMMPTYSSQVSTSNGTVERVLEAHTHCIVQP